MKLAMSVSSSSFNYLHRCMSLLSTSLKIFQLQTKDSPLRSGFPLEATRNAESALLLLLSSCLEADNIIYSYNGVSRSDSTACKMHVACSMLSQDHDPARSAIAVDSSHFRGGKGQNVSGWPFMAATTGVGKIGLPPRPWGHACIDHLQHVSPSPAAARSRAEAQ